MLTFVGEAQFKLLSARTQLGDYQFNKKVIHHRFCRRAASSRSRAAPAGRHAMIAINVRCLDGVDAARSNPKPLDGRKL